MATPQISYDVNIICDSSLYTPFNYGAAFAAFDGHENKQLQERGDLNSGDIRDANIVVLANNLHDYGMIHDATEMTDDKCTRTCGELQTPSSSSSHHLMVPRTALIPSDDLEELWENAKAPMKFPYSPVKLQEMDDANRPLSFLIAKLKREKQMECFKDTLISTVPEATNTKNVESNTVSKGKEKSQNVNLKGRKSTHAQEAELLRQQEEAAEKAAAEAAAAAEQYRLEYEELLKNRPRDPWVELAEKTKNESSEFIGSLQPQLQWAQTRGVYFSERAPSQYFIEDVLGEFLSPKSIPEPTPFTIDAIQYSQSRLKMLEKEIGYKATRGLHLIGTNEDPTIDPELALAAIGSLKLPSSKIKDIVGQKHSQEFCENGFLTAEDAQKEEKDFYDKLLMEHDAGGFTESYPFICRRRIQININTSRNLTSSVVSQMKDDTDYNMSIKHFPQPPNSKVAAKTLSCITDASALIECSSKHIVFVECHPYKTYIQKMVVWNRDKCPRRIKLHQSPHSLIAVNPLSMGIHGSNSRKPYDPATCLVCGETLEFEVAYSPINSNPLETELKIAHTREVNGLNTQCFWTDIAIPIRSSGAMPMLELVTHPCNVIGVYSDSSISVCNSGTSRKGTLTNENDNPYRMSNPGFLMRQELRTMIRKIRSAEAAKAQLSEKLCTPRDYESDFSLGNNSKESKTAKKMTMAAISQMKQLEDLKMRADDAVNKNNYITLTPCVVFSRVIKKVRFYNAGSSGYFAFSIDATEEAFGGRNPFRVEPSEINIENNACVEMEIFFEPFAPSVYTSGFIDVHKYFTSCDTMTSKFADSEIPLPLPGHPSEWADLVPKASATLRVKAWHVQDEERLKDECVHFHSALEAIAIVPTVRIDAIGETKVPSATIPPNTVEDALSIRTNSRPLHNEQCNPCLDITNRDLLSQVPVLYFKDACDKHTSTESIRVINAGPISVDFTWDVSALYNDNIDSYPKKDRSLQKENPPTVIVTPSTGTLPPNSTTTFILQYYTQKVTRMESLLKMMLLGLPDPALVVFADEEMSKIKEIDVPTLEILLKRSPGPIGFLSRVKPIPDLETAQLILTDSCAVFNSTGKHQSDHPQYMANTTLSESPLTESTKEVMRHHYSIATVALKQKDEEKNHESADSPSITQRVYWPHSRQQQVRLVPQGVTGDVIFPKIHFFPSAFSQTVTEDFTHSGKDIGQLITTLMSSRAPVFGCALRCFADPIVSTVSVAPTLIIDKISCLIGCENKRQFQIINHSNRPQNFWMDPPRGSAHPRYNGRYRQERASLSITTPIPDQCHHEQGRDCTLKFTPGRGVIEPNASLTVTCNMMLNTIGNHKIDVECYLPDLEGGVEDDQCREEELEGMSQWLTIETSAIGPALSVSTKVMDFGVIPLGEEGECRITLTNNNPVPVTFTVKDPLLNDQCTIDTNSERQNGDAAVVTGNKHQITKNRDPNTFVFLPQGGKLRQGSSIDLTVFRRGLIPEHVQEIVHICVARGQITPIEVHALIQMPSATITPSIVDCGVVSRDVPCTKEIFVSNHSPINLSYQFHVFKKSLNNGVGPSVEGMNALLSLSNGHGGDNDNARVPDIVVTPSSGVLTAGQRDLPLRIVATFSGTDRSPQAALVIMTSPQLSEPIPVKVCCTEVTQLVVSLGVFVVPEHDPLTIQQGNEVAIINRGTNVRNDRDELRLFQSIWEFLYDIVVNIIENAVLEDSGAFDDQSSVSVKEVQEKSSCVPGNHYYGDCILSHPEMCPVPLPFSPKVRPFCPTICIPFATLSDTCPFSTASAILRVTNHSGCISKFYIYPQSFYVDIESVSRDYNVSKDENNTKNRAIGYDMMLTDVKACTRSNNATSCSADQAKHVMHADINTSGISFSSYDQSKNSRVYQQKPYHLTTLGGSAGKKIGSILPIPKLKNLDSKFQVKHLDGREDVEAFEEQRLRYANSVLMDGKGCSIKIFSYLSDLMPYETREVSLSITANIPGRYKDKLSLVMDGMPTVDVNVDFQVRGKVVILDPATSGLSIHGDTLAGANASGVPSLDLNSMRSSIPRLMLPTLVGGLSKVSRKLRLTSRCPRDVEVYARFLEADKFYNLSVKESSDPWSDAHCMGVEQQHISVSVSSPETNQEVGSLPNSKCESSRSGYRQLENRNTSESKRSDYRNLEPSRCRPSHFILKKMETVEVIIEHTSSADIEGDWKAVLVITTRLARTQFNEKFLVDEFYRLHGEEHGYVPFTRTLSSEGHLTNSGTSKNNQNLQGVFKVDVRVPLINRPGIIVNSVITNPDRSSGNDVTFAEKYAKASQASDTTPRCQESDYLSLATTCVYDRTETRLSEESTAFEKERTLAKTYTDDSSDDSDTDNVGCGIKPGMGSQENIASKVYAVDIEVAKRRREARRKRKAECDERAVVKEYVTKHTQRLIKESEEYFSPIEVLVMARCVKPMLTADPKKVIHFPLCSSYDNNHLISTLNSSDNSLALSKRNTRTLQLSNSNASPLTFSIVIPSLGEFSHEPNKLSLPQLNISSNLGYDAVRFRKQDIGVCGNSKAFGSLEDNARGMKLFKIKRIQYVCYDDIILGKRGISEVLPSSSSIFADHKNTNSTLKKKSSVSVTQTYKSTRGSSKNSELFEQMIFKLLPMDTLLVTLELDVNSAQKYIAERSREKPSGPISTEHVNDTSTDDNHGTINNRSIITGKEKIDGELRVNFVKPPNGDDTGTEDGNMSYQTFHLLATMHIPHVVPYPDQILFRPMMVSENGRAQTHYKREIILYNYSMVDAPFIIKPRVAIEAMNTVDTIEKKSSVLLDNILRDVKTENYSMKSIRDSPTPKLYDNVDVAKALETIDTNFGEDGSLQLSKVKKVTTMKKPLQLPPLKSTINKNTVIKNTGNEAVEDQVPVFGNESVIDIPENEMAPKFTDIEKVDDPTRFTIYPMCGRVPAATIGGAPGTTTITVEFKELSRIFFETKYEIGILTESDEQEMKTDFDNGFKARDKQLLPPSTFVLRGESKETELI